MGTSPRSCGTPCWTARPATRARPAATCASTASARCVPGAGLRSRRPRPLHPPQAAAMGSRLCPRSAASSSPPAAHGPSAHVLAGNRSPGGGSASSCSTEQGPGPRRRVTRGHLTGRRGPAGPSPAERASAAAGAAHARSLQQQPPRLCAHVPSARCRGAAGRRRHRPPEPAAASHTASHATSRHLRSTDPSARSTSEEPSAERRGVPWGRRADGAGAPLCVLQNVGCDFEIDSGAVEDRCGVCQGNGSTCHTVSGTFQEAEGLGTGGTTGGAGRPLLVPRPPCSRSRPRPGGAGSDPAGGSRPVPRRHPWRG